MVLPVLSAAADLTQVGVGPTPWVGQVSVAVAALALVKPWRANIAHAPTITELACAILIGRL